MTRIAIMQPYLLPYAGYFRLMTGVDAFVVGDVQQFPRRGWVHRNRLLDDRGQAGWLTLPLRSAPLATPIHALDFAEGAPLTLSRNMARFTACRSVNPVTAPIVERLRAPDGTPKAVIMDTLAHAAGILGTTAPVLYQSDLGIVASLSPTEQICAICETLKATEYVNAPGGRALYAAADFARRGIRLLFLPPYAGSHLSILQRLADEDPAVIRAEIASNMDVEAG